MLYGAIASSELKFVPPLSAAASFSGIGDFSASASIIENQIKQANASFAGVGQLGIEASIVGEMSAGATFAGVGSFSIDAAFPPAELQASAAFAGSGGMLAFSSEVAYSVTLTSDGGNGNGASQRILKTLSKGGSFIRVKFNASTANVLQTNHCSIGIRSTTYNTNATPVELKFSGASGFSISAGQTIMSDWAQLTTAPSDVVVVIMDLGANAYERYVAGAGIQYYYKATTASYDQASPSGVWTDNTLVIGISEIDVG